MSFFKRLLGIMKVGHIEVFTKVSDQTWGMIKVEVIKKVSDDVSGSSRGTV